MPIFEELPTEIIECIVEDEVMDCEAFCHLSSTSSRFREIGLHSNSVWRKKIQSQFPSLYKWYPRENQLEVNWRDQCKDRFQIGAIVRREVGLLSSKHHQKIELSNHHFGFLDDLMLAENCGNRYIHLHIIDELRTIIHGNSTKPIKCYEYKNLTLKYYAKKAIKHIKHRIFKQTWIIQEHKISLEDAMIKIAQWCQPTEEIIENEVCDQLDKFAIDTLAVLLSRFPHHPIFKTIREQNDVINYGPTISLPHIPGILTKSLWSPTECRELLESANYYLYQVVGLTGNTTDYYSAENSFINKILETKTGIPVTLCILYASVLARLGVFCEPVNFPIHFLLRFLEHPHLDKEEDRYTYIDAFQNGRLITSDQAKSLAPNMNMRMTQENFQSADTMDVAKRILRNLISIGASRANHVTDPRFGDRVPNNVHHRHALLRNSLELMLILEGSNENPKVFYHENLQYTSMLSRVYLELGINQENVLKMLDKYKCFLGISDQLDYLQQACQFQIAERNSSETANAVKKRDMKSPGGPVRLWIGMVAKHKKYNCNCVIYGWEPICTATESWINAMGVHKLQRQEKQPFYNVLVEDGSNRYAADENLEYIDPVEVQHEEIGRFFEEFCPQKGYIPNDEKKMEYPDDQDIMEIYENITDYNNLQPVYLTPPHA